MLNKRFPFEFYLSMAFRRLSKLVLRELFHVKEKSPGDEVAVFLLAFRSVSLYLETIKISVTVNS